MPFWPSSPSNRKLICLGATRMFTRAQPAIGLPRFKMSDASVGVRTWGPTTAYAGGVALAATWDRSLRAQNKPAGLVVHPGSGNWQGNAAQRPAASLPAARRHSARAGIVHRLDKDTSGLLVVAKTLEAQTDLVRQLQARTVKRIYLALVHGVVARDGSVDAPIGRHQTQRTRMAVTEHGRPARTHYRVLERYASSTLLEPASLDTGRTPSDPRAPAVDRPSAGGRSGLSRRARSSAGAAGELQAPGAATPTASAWCIR